MERREIWDGSEPVRAGSVPADVKTYALVNGAVIPLNEGDDFRQAVRNLSMDAGFGKFKVYLNKNEVRPSEAPDTLNRGDVLEIRPYDVAGC